MTLIPIRHKPRHEAMWRNRHRRKDHANTLKLNIIITSTKDKGDNNFNNFDNDKDYKKNKIFKFNKYYSEREKLEP